MTDGRVQMEYEVPALADRVVRRYGFYWECVAEYGVPAQIATSLRSSQ